MQNIRYRFYFDLYLLTKSIQAHVKMHNADNLAKVVILQLLLDGKTSASAIAKETSIKLSAMMTRLQGMEKDNLIERIQGKDHREYIAHITSEGNQYLNGVKKSIITKCAIKKSELSDEEISTALRVIDAFRKKLI